MFKKIALAFFAISVVCTAFVSVSIQPALAQDGAGDALIADFERETGSFGLFAGMREECRENGNCNICDIVALALTTVSMMFTISGALLLLVFIYGGIEMIMSAGDSAVYGRGNKRLKTGVTGLVIMLLAWLLVGTIISVAVNPSSSADPGSDGQLTIGDGSRSSLIRWNQIRCR